MKINIAFFHIGSNAWQAEMLCRSAKAVYRNEKIRTIQLSNYSTPKTKSADLIFRSNKLSMDNLMLSRMIAYKECLKILDEPTYFFDTDILIIRKLKIDASSGPVLCKREYNLDRKLAPFAELFGEKKVYFNEQGGIPLGKVYPYVGCFFADKETTFLEYAIEIYSNLDSNYHLWFGDQIALREAAKKFNIFTAPESKIACNPIDFSIDTQSIKALHFKGHSAKSMMNKFYLKIFSTKTKALQTSFRSNPSKPGFEIPNILNPYFKDYFAGASSAPTQFVNPTDLDLGLRSDILCKVMYLLSTKLNLLPTSLGISTYNKSVSSLNGFKGADSPSKTTPDDYYNQFVELFDDLKRSGSYDSQKSAVPISSNNVPIDGSHRVSVAIALNIDIPIIKLPVKNVPEIPFSLLSSRFGLSAYEKMLAVRTYIRYKDEVQLFVFFPARNSSKDQQVLKLIEKYIRIDEQINIQISSTHQAAKLIKNIYPGSKWLGSVEDGFNGLKWKATQVLGTGGNALFIIGVPNATNKLKNNASILKDIKEIARSIYQIGFHSIHSADNTDERMILFDNFILNEHLGQKDHLTLGSSEAITNLLTSEQRRFLDALATRTWRVRERTLISGGLVLALLGIRSTKDIDLVTDMNYDDFSVESHNAFVEKYGACDNFYDYIRDPMRTLWLMHNGRAIRVISPLELRKIKANRLACINSDKDRFDIERIDSFLMME